MSPQIDYPEVAEGITPRHRFMSAYEQRIEPPDRRWQYLLMAAEPYETIAFKVACQPLWGGGLGVLMWVSARKQRPLCVPSSDMSPCRAVEGFLDHIRFPGS